MGLPTAPVTLSVAQIEELNKKMSFLRHDVNNHISLMIAAIELIQYKPDMTEKMLASLMEQMPRVTSAVGKFSDDFEASLGITRP